MAETEGQRAGAQRPSMADVARLAGVSSQTVSRVSNGQANVDDSTRARVLDAMQSLGYRPNGAARALKSGRFHTIGVIMTTLQTLGNVRTLDAVAAEASRDGYSVLLMPINDPTLQGVSGAYQRLSAQAVDGALIILEARFLDRADFVLPPGIPVVVVDSGAGPGYTVVDTDQALGARQATRHLLGLGHRQVWHIAGPETSFSAAHRAESWERTLREAGITPPEVLRGDWTGDSGYVHGMELGRRPDVTAIFAANDEMALGAMRALHELGRDIPGDVSVVGFDDMGASGSFWPPLTTVRQDFAAVGRLSIQKLLRKVADATLANDTTSVPTELIIRRSTAAPPPQLARLQPICRICSRCRRRTEHDHEAFFVRSRLKPFATTKDFVIMALAGSARGWPCGPRPPAAPAAPQGNGTEPAVTAGRPRTAGNWAG